MTANGGPGAPARGRLACVVAALLGLGCGEEGPAGPPLPQVAGEYDVRFEATEAVGCEGMVEPGSFDGVLEIDQEDEEVTLRFADLTPLIHTDPVGTIDGDGRFRFEGTISIGDDETSTSAGGTIDGFFNLLTGAVDLEFDFTAFTCRVRGNIMGQRRDAP